jgi:hypothetical protein
LDDQGQEGDAVSYGFLQSLPLGKDGGPELPTKLGLAGRARFLFLASAKTELSGAAGLRWKGARYEILSTQTVYLGRDVSHRRAVLRLWEPRENEVTP